MLKLLFNLFFKYGKGILALLSRFTLFKSLFQSIALLRFVLSLKGFLTIFSKFFNFFGSYILIFVSHLNKLVKRDVTVLMLVLTTFRFIMKYTKNSTRFGSVMTYALLFFELVTGITIISSLLDSSGNYVSEILNKSDTYKNYLSPAMESVQDFL